MGATQESTNTTIINGQEYQQQQQQRVEEGRLSQSMLESSKNFDYQLDYNMDSYFKDNNNNMNNNNFYINYY